jgi:hypothetical protein
MTRILIVLTYNNPKLQKLTVPLFFGQQVSDSSHYSPNGLGCRDDFESMSQP